ncbi:hypothetical protein PoMZ_08154 [Pyricularia oryzae]|uniref:Uncharacterized protein n=1 Tax=Pyricularia oryzae TaxID=318829 RepID=A0A4P7NH58_PYROR|nr:hypothetical protein PoMZ_08154 [Pyricularia oryzae]
MYKTYKTRTSPTPSSPISPTRKYALMAAAFRMKNRS